MTQEKNRIKIAIDDSGLADESAGARGLTFASVLVAEAFGRRVIVAIAAFTQDGRTFYAENADLDLNWLSEPDQKRVKRGLVAADANNSRSRFSEKQIAALFSAFVGDNPQVWVLDEGYAYGTVSDVLIHSLGSVPKNWPKSFWFIDQYLETLHRRKLTVRDHAGEDAFIAVSNESPQSRALLALKLFNYINGM